MATLIKPDGSATRVAPAHGKHFSLEELQGFVGGYIERAFTHGGRQIFLNEEGKLRGLPINLVATLMYQHGNVDSIVGTVVVLDESEEEDE